MDIQQFCNEQWNSNVRYIWLHRTWVTGYHIFGYVFVFQFRMILCNDWNLSIYSNHRQLKWKLFVNEIFRRWRIKVFWYFYRVQKSRTKTKQTLILFRLNIDPCMFKQRWMTWTTTLWLSMLLRYREHCTKQHTFKIP